MNYLRQILRVSCLLPFLCFLAFAGCKPSASTVSSLTDESSDSERESDLPKQGVTANAEGVMVIHGGLDSVDWESLVGKQVAIEGDLTVVDTWDLIRRGQVKVARERLYIPTTHTDPNDSDPNGSSHEGGNNVAQVTAAQKLNDLSTIILDDGSAEQNVFPPGLFPNLGDSQPTIRVGSVIHGVSGEVVRAGSALLLVADQPLDWQPAARPARPTLGEPDITVASFNVLNYFTTIDDGSNNARGADSNSEFDRQETKIVSAIIALQADVVGVMEIENNIEAELKLVAAINNKLGQDVFKACGLPENFRSAPGGSDAIRVGIIYRSDRVMPLGDVSMIQNDAFRNARTPIVQVFEPKGGGKAFEVVVNHFKSKGGASDADAANKNKGDGQGAFNAARRGQSLAISDHIEGRIESDPSARILVIGDLNAYQQEDPIDALRSKGLVDLHERFGDQPASGTDGHYSYVYYGQSGSLDHALATESFVEDVTGVATWHINADEPRSLDYNEEYNPTKLYQPDPFRSSDHDPVLIGIRK